MTNVLCKFALVATSVALSFTVVEVKQVQAATISWDLEFFDNAGAQLGNGQFSYNTDTTTFVQTIPISSPMGFNVQNALESFSANIQAQSWGFEAPGVTWWVQSSRPPGQQRNTRYGIFIADNSWFFGDVVYGTRQLLLDNMKSVSDQVWTGDWFQQIVQSGGGAPFQGDGAWTATQRNTEVVPEPSSVLSSLAISTFGIGLALKRKVNKQKSAENRTTKLGNK